MGDHALVRMLRKLTVSYGPTEMLYIWASPGGLPASEASPSRHADCGTGTTGRRRPPPVESVLTGGPDRPRPGSIYTLHTLGRKVGGGGGHVPPVPPPVPPPLDVNLCLFSVNY